jgi:hypothetical protein
MGRETVQVFMEAGGGIVQHAVNAHLSWLFARGHAIVPPVNRVAAPLSSILQTGVIHVALTCH